MSAAQFMFYLLGVSILAFSVMTVISRKILRAAIYLLFTLIATAGLYFLLDYDFLAAVQLTVYAGGIVVLIIFSILLTSQISGRMEWAGAGKLGASGLAAFAGLLLTLSVIGTYKFRQPNEGSEELTMTVIGEKMLSYGENGYVLPFEVISILLLAAMIGAIVMARKDKIEETLEEVND